MARLFSARTLVLGGVAAAAAGTVAFKYRSKVAGLIGRGSSTPDPYPLPQDAPVGTPASTPGPAPAPAVANADIPGPPTNTATAVPAPEPQVHPAEGGIDEAAEEAAAAAEAANIGGPSPEYAGPAAGEAADAATAPLEEAGEGESEGLEQAEADLADNAEEAAGDRDPAARQIEDTIEAQDDPTVGEDLDELSRAEPADTLSGTTSAAEKSSNVWKKDEEDESSEWQTWSGQAVDPKQD